MLLKIAEKKRNIKNLQTADYSGDYDEHTIANRTTRRQFVAVQFKKFREWDIFFLLAPLRARCGKEPRSKNKTTDRFFYYLEEFSKGTLTSYPTVAVTLI